MRLPTVVPRHKFRGLNLLNVALVAVVVAVAVTAYLLFFRDESEAAGTTRPSVAVARGEVVASVSSSGTLQSSRSAAPQFTTSGTVVAVYVKVGQVVAKDAAIAKIDPAPAQRQVRIAEQNQIAAANSVDAAQESLNDAEQAAEDAEQASATPTTAAGDAAAGGQGAVQSQQDPALAVTNAKASLARAKADREQADQNLEAARAAVAATTLRAPIAGTITAVNGSVGSVAGGSSGTGSSGVGSGGTGSGATSGTTGSGSGAGSGTTSSTSTSASGFAELADLTALQVVAAFPEADAVKIKPKQAATVTLNADPGSPLPATLLSVSPTPTTTNGVVSYSATFSLTKLPAGARIGQTASVAVQTAKASNALFVPSTAVATSGTTHTVTLTDGTTREVQVGVQGGSFTEIKSGLKEGEQVELLQGAIGGTGTGGGQGRQFPAGQLGQGAGQGGGQFGQGGGANRGR
ncbi:efflux RND transporter periplasmic adaptor subunit [Kribbella sp. CA-253562]|uniref:efflux RND transporter periplasmic adaptor subunit n=1 Tax=Kribbella sp. CA-253562 TaxID=3239942 RepID=UPI003D8D8019